MNLRFSVKSLSCLAWCGALTMLACQDRTTIEPPPKVKRAPVADKAKAASRTPKIDKAPPEPRLPGIAKADEAFTAKLIKMYEAKGTTYKPRTHHKDKAGRALYTNRLIGQTSPYLIQHAHNPVNWYPWSEEAFEAARALNRPVLLSVGYSTCHWCHVMERESFEDKEIAAYINANFIPIKVDREERPDIDDVYMLAVRMLTGRGGWPMTVVMTPQKAPFFGGTYFPANDGDRGARRGFSTILKDLKRRYDENPDGVAAQAKRLSQRMAARSNTMAAGNIPTEAVIHREALNLHKSFDAQFGGFGRAPKFPLPSRVDVLLRFARRTSSDVATKDVAYTLEKMSTGGIYDQVGGGFHRYSVDARWLVPHFEKMLYDNAQLATLYTQAFQHTKRQDFNRIAQETLRYIQREMTSPTGGFYSATDADSVTPKGHMEEGYYFTWTPAELKAALGEVDAKKVEALMGVRPQGNFEGRTILNLKLPLEAALRAQKLSMSWWKEVREKLYQSRAKRPAPLRDDKVLASWNGLAMSAFAAGAHAFDDDSYLKTARKAATFITTTMRTPEGRLLRSYKDGKTTKTAFLDDYAFVIQGLLDLYGVSQEIKWLNLAIALQQQQDKDFLDSKDGTYFTTANHEETLLVRQKPMYDGAQPSGNSVTASNLLRLYTLTTKHEYKKQAERLIGAMSAPLSRGGRGLSRLLGAIDFYHDRVPEIVIVKPNKQSDTSAMLNVVRQTYLPNHALTVLVAGDTPHAMLVPYAAKKPARGGKVTAYVCEHGRCELPTTDPKVFAKQIRVLKPLNTKSMPKLIAKP